MEKRRRIPRSVIEPLVRAGMKNWEIEQQLGVARGSMRKRLYRIRSDVRRQATNERLQAGMVTYHMTAAEIEQRYGKPGEYVVKPRRLVIDIYSMERARERRLEYET